MKGEYDPGIDRSGPVRRYQRVEIHVTVIERTINDTAGLCFLVEQCRSRPRTPLTRELHLKAYQIRRCTGAPAGNKLWVHSCNQLLVEAASQHILYCRDSVLQRCHVDG